MLAECAIIRRAEGEMAGADSWLAGRVGSQCWGVGVTGEGVIMHSVEGGELKTQGGGREEGA